MAEGTAKANRSRPAGEQTGERTVPGSRLTGRVWDLRPAGGVSVQGTLGPGPSSRHLPASASDRLTHQAPSQLRR